METINDLRDERGHRHEHQSPNSRVLIGVILVLAGLALVIRNTGFFPDFIDHVIFSWPMLLVTIGLVMTLGSTEKTAGIIVMAVGGFFMIPLIFRETFHMSMFWPSIFIIIGIIFIVTKRRGWGSVTSTGLESDDYVDYVTIFSGSERQVISQNFKGGKMSAVFGGVDIDLTKAKLAPGRNVLEVAAVFGGVGIIVPDDWFVTIEVTPVLGGFSDSRRLAPGMNFDRTSQLVIKGAVVFGGGEVKNHK